MAGEPAVRGVGLADIDEEALLIHDIIAEGVVGVIQGVAVHSAVGDIGVLQGGGGVGEDEIIVPLGAGMEQGGVHALGIGPAGEAGGARVAVDGHGAAHDDTNLAADGDLLEIMQGVDMGVRAR